MNEDEIKALEILLEDTRRFIYAEYQDYISRFISKQTFEVYCDHWHKDLMGSLETLEKVLER